MNSRLMCSYVFELVVLDHSSDIPYREWWVAVMPRISVTLCEETGGDTHGNWDQIVPYRVGSVRRKWCCRLLISNKLIIILHRVVVREYY